MTAINDRGVGFALGRVRVLCGVVIGVCVFASVGAGPAVAQEGEGYYREVPLNEDFSTAIKQIQDELTKLGDIESVLAVSTKGEVVNFLGPKLAAAPEKGVNFPGGSLKIPVATNDPDRPDWKPDTSIKSMHIIYEASPGTVLNCPPPHQLGGSWQCTQRQQP